MRNIKVYVINCNQSEFDFRTAEREGNYKKIKDEAERLGSVYSLQDFQDAINDENLDLGNAFILIR